MTPYFVGPNPGMSRCERLVILRVTRGNRCTGAWYTLYSGLECALSP